ncbi:helix-turn-helix transcriptional regulator [Kribbella hippodromi]|uniref:helix-turn-helix transcriptional regulator n=1 Tax=Kribbella hippodromi TaxID=434347 RepID=UPI0031D46CE8
MTNSADDSRGDTAFFQAAAHEELAEGREALREGFEQHEKILGAKIRQLREERRWSQSDLADQLSRLGFDLHQTTIAKMEAGRRPLRVSEAVAVAHVCGLPAGALFWLPVQGEPSTLEFLREKIQDLEQQVEQTRQLMSESLATYAGVYAEQSTSLHMAVAAMSTAEAEIVEREARQAAVARQAERDAAAKARREKAVRLAQQDPDAVLEALNERRDRL